MKKIKLKDLVEIVVGKTPSRSFEGYWGVGSNWACIADMNKLDNGKFISFTKEQVTNKAVEDSRLKLLPKNTVLLSFKLSIGKVAISSGDIYTNEAIAGLKIKDPKVISHTFLFYALQATNIIRYSDHSAKGKLLNKGKLGEIEIPVPKQSIQNRIVNILDNTNKLITKNKEKNVLLNKLLNDSFLELFQSDLLSDISKFFPLEKIASVVSGITKGRKSKETLYHEVPYLRVANVQDGYFDLDEIKFIKATTNEISKYSVIRNDIFLTEGGDPDKLGRGSIWEKDDSKLIYQNHLFRIRLNNDIDISPYWLSFLFQSTYGKTYFLSQAKQTTGIASINARQVKGFPIPISDYNKQLQFEKTYKHIRHLILKNEITLISHKLLFQSIMHKAFNDELLYSIDLELNSLLRDDDIESIKSDQVYFQKLIDRLEEQKFDTMDDYDKSKEIIFTLLKDEDSNISQTFDTKTEKISLTN